MGDLELVDDLIVTLCICMHEMSCLSRDLPTETAVMCAILNFRSFFGDSRPIWTTLAATNFDRFQIFFLFDAP